MDLEGIDVAVLYPPGSGEEWAMDDAEFAGALCRTLNDARAEFASHAPERIKLVAKLPMIEPKLAAEELERCVTEHGFVGLVTATHIRDKNLDDPSLRRRLGHAQRLGVAVCAHGGGQAPGQTAVRDRALRDAARHPRDHAPGRRDAGGAPLHGRRHPAPLPATARRLHGGRRRLAAVLARPARRALGAHPRAGAGHRPAAVGVLPAAAASSPPSPATGRCVGDRGAGPGRGLYASDYYHWDSEFPDSVKIFAERGDLDARALEQLFSANAARLYRLPVPARSSIA
jgi:hypothetical protein